MKQNEERITVYCVLIIVLAGAVCTLVSYYFFPQRYCLIIENLVAGSVYTLVSVLTIVLFDNTESCLLSICFR